MVHASDLQHLSITGRYAFALACVERLCAEWAVDDRFVLTEIDAHWQATEIPLACHWFDQHPFPRHAKDFAGKVGSTHLSEDQIQSLYHALDEARMVVCRSCYAAASDNDSMQSVLNVVGVL